MNMEHSSPVTEEQILEALRRVPQERWGAVLRFLVDQEEGARLAAEFDPANPLARKLTPRQVALLPREQIDAIYAAGAAVAEEIYRSGSMNEDFHARNPPNTDPR
jgi:hypothetical protein